MQKIKQLDIDKDHGMIFALSEFAFQYELPEADRVKKIAEARRHIIWGMMDGEQVAAKLHLIPLSCYINGKVFDMGGVSSVASWPEYRRKGMAKHLLLHALQYMKQHGQTVSFLHPFSVPFYRKYGWELTFNDKSYSIPMENLKRNWEAEGYVRRIQQDIPLLNTIYTAYAEKFTGMVLRDEMWWEQRVLNKKSHVAVAYNEDGNAEGYIIFHVKDNVFTVTEMAYSAVNGWKLLLQFIANHDSMAKKVNLIVPENDNLPLLLDEPRFDQKIVPYFMARIVDVPAFLEQYPFEASNDARSVLLSIEDSFLPENNGTYELQQTGKGITVTRKNEIDPNAQLGIHCSVQLLTSMLLGYKRPLELFDVGLLTGNRKDMERLEEYIPKQQPYFSDFF